MSFAKRSYAKQLLWFLGCLRAWETELAQDVRRARERGLPTLAVDLERLRCRVLDMVHATGVVLDEAREVAERQPARAP